MAQAKRTKTRRTERCVYIEGGARCRRSGTGDPSLCNPHRIVMQDAGRPPPAFGNGMRDLVDRFVSGRRVTRKVWEDALGDVVTAWSAHHQAQQEAGGHTPPPGSPPPGQRPWWHNIPHQRSGPRSPPPPRDPAIDERTRARITLGFKPTEPLTLEMIQKRRRELARKHHPDRGGSVTKMQAVNAAADVLEQEIRAS